MKSLFLIVEGFIGLLHHDRYMRRHSFADLCDRLRSTALEKSSDRPSTNHLEPLATSVALACLFYPKQVLCLQRASVLCQMLRKRGVHAQFVVGIQQNPFRAHAWVEVDRIIINDTLPVRESFQVIEVCG